MKAIKKTVLHIAAAFLAIGATAAHADIRITEVAAWGSSSDTPYKTDWFELTNTGTSAVSIAGWKMDDDSKKFANAVALTGITSIKAGESVVFTENAASASFLSTWFGNKVPAGLQIGTYTGGGVGLSQSGDQVNIFNASGVLQANVIFGSSGNSIPYQTFDNSAALNNVTLTQFSANGVNGAHNAVSGIAEIGSPGTIAAVPEPESYAMFLAGLGLVGAIARKRKA